jgi:beta/gamma crystallin
MLAHSEADLRQSGWNNMISSARRLRGGGGPGIRPPIQPLPTGLELFSRTRFSGDRRLFSTGQSDLRRVGFNDVAQSLRLGRGQAWEVCVDIDFGNCRVVNSDWQELSRLGISRRISSVRPWRQVGGGQTYVVLFDNRGYRGRSFRVDSAAAVLSGFANRAESIQVSGGAWQLCERSSFGGPCVVVSGNMTDLSAIGLRNRVASVRPVLDREIARSRDDIAASLDN